MKFKGLGKGFLFFWGKGFRVFGILELLGKIFNVCLNIFINSF